jgi:hypothetical protein
MPIFSCCFGRSVEMVYEVFWNKYCKKLMHMNLFILS